MRSSPYSVSPRSRRDAPFGWGEIMIAMFIGFLIGVLIFSAVSEELARRDRIRGNDLSPDAPAMAVWS